MKKIILFIGGIFIILLSFGQTNFKWEKIDSVSKTKSQIYSDTKMFIAKNWKSAKSVIQNDDKDAGNILIKCSSIRKVPFMMLVFVYIYNYNVEFKMKDGKYKLIIDNVYCESAFQQTGRGRVTKIDPFDGDNCPKTGTISAPGLPQKKAIKMMKSFKQDLQSIIYTYEAYIKTQSSSNDDW
jgi:uncharacterized protein YsxB (DUF464 family)